MPTGEKIHFYMYFGVQIPSLALFYVDFISIKMVVISTFLLYPLSGFKKV